MKYLFFLVILLAACTKPDLPCDGAGECLSWEERYWEVRAELDQCQEANKEEPPTGTDGAGN